MVSCILVSSSGYIKQFLFHFSEYKFSLKKKLAQIYLFFLAHKLMANRFMLIIDLETAYASILTGELSPFLLK